MHHAFVLNLNIRILLIKQRPNIHFVLPRVWARQNVIEQIVESGFFYVHLVLGFFTGQLVVVVEVLGLGGGWVFMAAKKLLARKYKPSRCTFPLGICAPLEGGCGGGFFGDIWKSF